MPPSSSMRSPGKRSVLETTPYRIFEMAGSGLLILLGSTMLAYAGFREFVPGQIGGLVMLVAGISWMHSYRIGKMSAEIRELRERLDAISRRD